MPPDHRRRVTRFETERATPDRNRVTVGIADLAVTDAEQTLTTSGLGSCVAVTVHDDAAGVAGLVHAMLPRAADGTDANPVKYADTGVERLYDAAVTAGASSHRLEAKLVGGSHMFDFGDADERIGARNVSVARETLERLGVPVVAEDVGGESGRSVRFDPETGALTVRKAGAAVRTI
jgi:chemotaxis protein CheD